MSEEEDDELPPITVNSSNRDSSWFSMPCASELASQRAREERCEEELRRLRRDHTHATEELSSRAPQSDSSGSEGEAALAAAVTALRVRPGAPPARPRPRLAALLAALPAPAPALPFLPDYLRAVADQPPRRVQRIDDDVAGGVGCVVEGGGALSSAEALCCGAWLCCAVCARAAGPPRRAAALRRLLLLLDERAAPDQVAALSRMLVGAEARVWDARARLELADALRGGGAHARRLAADLGRAALAGLLPPADYVPRVSAGAWRRLEPRDQYVALQLAGRARAEAAGGDVGAAEGGLLEALAAAAPPSRDHRPDTLKVLVAASKLQVLFHVKK